MSPVDDAKREALAASLLDIRESIEAMSRSVAGVQSSLDDCRQTESFERLIEMVSNLTQLTYETGVLAEFTAIANSAMLALIDRHPTTH